MRNSCPACKAAQPRLEVGNAITTDDINNAGQMGETQGGLGRQRQRYNATVPRLEDRKTIEERLEIIRMFMEGITT